MCGIKKGRIPAAGAGGEFARQKTAPALRGQAKSAISHHPHLHQFHLAKSEMPATRRLASRITSFPRTLLVKSSWAFTPSTLLLLRIKRFGPPLVARQAPRSAQHSIITSALSRCTKAAQEKPAGREPAGCLIFEFISGRGLTDGLACQKIFNQEVMPVARALPVVRLNPARPPLPVRVVGNRVVK
jgi:hypothetical protein